MTSDTWQKLEDIYSECPGMRAEGVPQDEIDAASVELGIPFPSDYQQFLRRHGGGHAGSLTVSGLRRWKLAGRDDWSVIALTRRYRDQKYPGSDRWVIFSDDGFGNPVGFDQFGHIWLSDHNSGEFVCLEDSFENWIRRWALGVDAHRGGYIAQEK